MIKEITLDELYATIKSLSGTLTCAGWEVHRREDEFLQWGSEDSLLRWFLRKWQDVSKGLDTEPDEYSRSKLVCRKAFPSSYSVQEGSITMTSSIHALWVIVTLTVTRGEDNGRSGSWAGDYQSWTTTENFTYMIRT